MAAAARELSLYESQLYNWRSEQQQQMTSSDRESEQDAEIARLKRQWAEKDEELAILQNGRDILREAPEMKSVFIDKYQAEFSIKAMCRVRRVCMAKAAHHDGSGRMTLRTCAQMKAGFILPWLLTCGRGPLLAGEEVG